MKVAVMQPYLFPYIGYFQLISAADVFVILDDVNYIKKGWINRNCILVNNEKFRFSFPLLSVSQNSLINEMQMTANDTDNFLKTIRLSYSKAPYFNQVFEIIAQVFSLEERNLSRYIQSSLETICGYLAIKTQFRISSQIEKDNNLKGEEKIIEICRKLNASQYINPIGGTELYNRENFLKNNIQLNFIKSNEIVYKQFNSDFIPWLSIIDVLMFNSPEKVNLLLKEYKLI